VPGSVPAAQARVTVPPPELEWVEVPGGRLPASRRRPAIDVPDLTWGATPLTVAHACRLGYPALGCVQLPVTGITLAQASELAAAAGGRLPASAEWEWMAGNGVRRYPWGQDEPDGRRANLRGFGPGHTTPAGSYPHGATPSGLLDVAGNVWEWTASLVPGDGAVVRGGSYNSISRYARCAFTSDIPASIASPGIGLRVVRDR
jgi:formylglycine-generating enzyme